MYDDFVYCTCKCLRKNFLMTIYVFIQKLRKNTKKRVYSYDIGLVVCVGKIVAACRLVLECLWDVHSCRSEVLESVREGPWILVTEDWVPCRCVCWLLCRRSPSGTLRTSQRADPTLNSGVGRRNICTQLCSSLALGTPRLPVRYGIVWRLSSVLRAGCSTHRLTNGLANQS